MMRRIGKTAAVAVSFGLSSILYSPASAQEPPQGIDSTVNSYVVERRQDGVEETIAVAGLVAGLTTFYMIKKSRKENRRKEIDEFYSAPRLSEKYKK